MREIIISDYDPIWVALFEIEKSRLETSLASYAPAIEHIGSTSVPGLAAKPVIDIMVGIANEEDLDALIIPVETLDFEYVKQYEDVMPYRRYFRRDTGGIRSHHIHAVVSTHEFWTTHLAFRNHLRSNSADTSAYEALKRRLAVEYRFDPKGYTDAKAEFIQKIIVRTMAGASIDS
jgi:GrpB-like predicted nucleotidyltransferase (UPF0157 family)